MQYMEKPMYEIEDIILGMADLVTECRFLRRENEQLKIENEWLRERWKEYCQHTQMLPNLILELGCAIIDKECKRNETT